MAAKGRNLVSRAKLRRVFVHPCARNFWTEGDELTGRLRTLYSISSKLHTSNRCWC